MKYTMLALLLGVSFSLSAQDAPKRNGPPQTPPQRKPLTESQKKLRDEMVSKYDLNKNGKLEPDEARKMSEEDKKRMKDAGLGRTPPPPAPPSKKN
jgi:hypothetical protein